MTELFGDRCDKVKRVYFLRSHIADNIGSVAIIMLQIVVTIVVFNLFWSDFQELLQRNQVYESLNLENVACITLEDKNDDILHCLNKIDGITVIGENYNAVSFTSESDSSNVLIQPVSPKYTEVFNGNLSKGNWNFDELPSNVLSAVVSKSLSHKYKLSNTYTLYDASDGKSITVYISGVLKSDCMFVPPNSGISTSLINNIPSAMLVYCDEETAQAVFGDSIHTSIYTIVAHDRNTLEKVAESIDLKKYAYMDARGAKESDDYFVLSEMGIPLVITIIVLILCVANYSSYSMLSAIKREKEFAVYFICGSTWNNCLKLQLMEDLFIVAVPFVLSIIVCSVLSINRVGAVMSIQGLLLSVGLCIAVMLFSSFMALLRIKRNSPVEIIRRWL